MKWVDLERAGLAGVRMTGKHWISDTKKGKRAQRFKFLLNFVTAVIDDDCNKLPVNILTLNLFIKVV